MLPASDWSHANKKCRGRHQGYEHAIEIRRAHRKFAEVERVDKQRIQRAKQDRSSGNDQQNIVREQERFAREDFEFGTEADLFRSPGVQRQRTSNDER